jgi:cell division septum initiation protein DivIVA
METFEEQIQPFIKPLVERIEALEAENKQLKVAVEELKTQAQKPNPENKPNRTQTDVNPSILFSI